MRTSTTDQAFVRFEREGWDSIAHRYHRFLGPVTGRAAEALLDAAGVGPGDRLLDVATGPGYVAGLALDRGAEVTGTDLSARILALAHLLRPDLGLRVADAHDLPFPDEAFDATVAGFLLPHLADHARAVAEMVRVTASGGRVALSTWGAPEEVPMFSMLGAAAEAVGARTDPAVPAGPAFFHFSDAGRLTDLLSSAGLAEVGVTAVSLTHTVASLDALWEGLMSGTVRVSALVRGQGEDTRRRIRAGFERSLADLVGDGGEVTLPVRVLVGHGRRG
ncbi:class I SAM-dependent methyltransferase [Nocardiopsis lambiniae]|uniref:Methyltransferase domain-containing protein n=1 Tax=Nocardiopsis lambiniae TaxID=3075539 RepID=A0ABU2MGT8_9ACTN|nr:methyltransferase domain-containing protein [Nocardiopsis sp. DSM 44743]MDT0331750.1 methyltransferase domain-containing protein [Nocardiopsis sp. DSM 44743]